MPQKKSGAINLAGLISYGYHKRMLSMEIVKDIPEETLNFANSDN